MLNILFHDEMKNKRRKSTCSTLSGMSGQVLKLAFDGAEDLFSSSRPVSNEISEQKLLSD